MSDSNKPLCLGKLDISLKHGLTIKYPYFDYDGYEIDFLGKVFSHTVIDGEEYS